MYQTEVRKIMAAEYWVVEEFWMHVKILWAIKGQIHADIKMWNSSKVFRKIRNKSGSLTTRTTYEVQPMHVCMGTSQCYTRARASLLVAHFRANTAVTLTAPTHLSSISNLTVTCFNSCTVDSTHSHSPHHCDKLCYPPTKEQVVQCYQHIKTIQSRALMCFHSTKQQYSHED